ncbi:MFS transporter, partial [Kineococcus sp. T13]|uniref:MFS transporter n=1 Tax=Kineococcus vitellinus TaxID=2696565 RepID=UPI001411DBB2
FVAGTLLFCAASGLCALAPTLPLLVAARAVQGVGAALVVPGSLAVLESLLRPADRARAIGTWSALGGIAGAVGPLLGGVLVELSWRWVFLLPVPLGLLAAAAAGRHLPEPDAGASARNGLGRSAWRGLDLAGALLAAAALAGTTSALVQAPAGPRWAVVAAAAVGAATTGGFLLVERRARDPLLPPGLFASRQFAAANALTFVVYAALGGVFFLLVVVLQTGLGYSPLAAGAATLPVTVVMLVLSARAGRLAQRIGARTPLTVGPLVIGAGMLLLGRVGVGSSYLRDVLPAVLVFALGLAATVAPVTATALAAAPAQQAGIASGVNNALARTAQLVAVAGLPVLVGLGGSDYADPRAVTGAFREAMTACSVLAIAGAVLAWATIRDPGPGGVQQRAAGSGGRALLHCAVAGPPARTHVQAATGDPPRGPVT